MSDMWNLPWQALQKSLASRVGAQGIVGGAVLRGGIGQRAAAARCIGAGGADSWLSRVRRPGAPLRAPYPP
jgi:hypothetical protein